MLSIEVTDERFSLYISLGDSDGLWVIKLLLFEFLLEETNYEVFRGRFEPKSIEDPPRPLLLMSRKTCKSYFEIIATLIVLKFKI